MMAGAREREVVIAMDLGGSWVRVAIVDLAGRVVWREHQPTGSREGRDAVVRNVDAALEKGISRAAGMPVVGVGLGLAGPVDPETGVMYRPPNIPDLDGVSFKDLWQGRIEWPVVTGNDATLAALGEYVYGAGAGAHMLVYMTVSTGIGAGIVVDGQPLWGGHGMAGEVGHMTIDWNGVPLQVRGRRLLGGAGPRAPGSPAWPGNGWRRRPSPSLPRPRVETRTGPPARRGVRCGRAGRPAGQGYPGWSVPGPGSRPGQRPPHPGPRRHSLGGRGDSELGAPSSLGRGVHSRPRHAPRSQVGLQAGGESPGGRRGPSGRGRPWPGGRRAGYRSGKVEPGVGPCLELCELPRTVMPAHAGIHKGGGLLPARSEQSRAPIV